MKEAGTIGRGEVLLQLGVVAPPQLLRELRELAHPRAPVAISVLLEREDVLYSEPQCARSKTHMITSSAVFLRKRPHEESA